MTELGDYMKIDFIRIIKVTYGVVASPLYLFLVAIAIVAIYVAKSQTNYIGIKKIFTDYFGIFEKKYHHILLFWGCPFIFSLSLIQADVATSDTLDTIIVFLSIIIAMYFSILAILIGKQTDSSILSENHKKLLNESATIILVEVILCIICLIISISALLLTDSLPEIVLSILYFINYYFIFVMLLNILILMKRLKSLIDNP